MVIGDISIENSSINPKADFKVPSPSDRFLSFAFDFVVISPVSGLFSISFLKDLKESVIQNGSEIEIVKALFQWGFVYFSVYFLLLSLSLLFYSATPGQLVFSLRVKNQQPGRLNFLQAWVRAAGPWISFLFFGAPLLALFSTAKRTTFYDRWSDTFVYTLKAKGEPAPMDLEVRFIKQWTSISFALVYLVGFMQVFGLSHELDSSTYTKNSFGKECELLSHFKNSKLSTLDRALSLWMMDSSSENCLRKVLDSENVFKTNPDLSYFASALLTDDLQLKQEYTKEICDSGQFKNLYCSLLKNQDVGRLELSSLSSKIQWYKNAVDSKKDIESQFLALDEISEEPLVYERYMKEYTSAYLSVSSIRNSDSQMKDVKIVKRQVASLKDPQDLNLTEKQINADESSGEVLEALQPQIMQSKTIKKAKERFLQRLEQSP